MLIVQNVKHKNSLFHRPIVPWLAYEENNNNNNSWLIADINKFCRHVFATQKYMFSKFSAIHFFFFLSLYLIKISGPKFGTFYDC